MNDESGPLVNPFYIITLKNGSVFGDPVTTAGSPIVGGFFAWLKWLFRAIVAIVRVIVQVVQSRPKKSSTVQIVAPGTVVHMPLTTIVGEDGVLLTNKQESSSLQSFMNQEFDKNVLMNFDVANIHVKPAILLTTMKAVMDSMLPGSYERFWSVYSSQLVSYPYPVVNATQQSVEYSVPVQFSSMMNQPVSSDQAEYTPGFYFKGLTCFRNAPPGGNLDNIANLMAINAPMRARVVYGNFIPFVYRENELKFLVMNWPHPVALQSSTSTNGAYSYSFVDIGACMAVKVSDGSYLDFAQYDTPSGWSSQGAEGNGLPYFVFSLPQASSVKKDVEKFD